jgi:hypothetical protein
LLDHLIKENSGLGGGFARLNKLGISLEGVTLKIEFLKPVYDKASGEGRADRLCVQLNFVIYVADIDNQKCV